MVLTVGIAGLAFAYWTSDGTGTGDAETGDGQSVTIVQTSEVTADGSRRGGPDLERQLRQPRSVCATVTTVTVTHRGRLRRRSWRLRD